ncbi:hypothetical protein KSS87_022497 [Heliosperma pusillum]|nr:hypothetical protein KSS87_022497 [Heliosperma pusillum]
MSDKELRSTYHDIRLRNWMAARRNMEVVSHKHNVITRELGGHEAGENEPEGSRNGSVMATLGGEGDQLQGSFMQALKDPVFLAEFHALRQKLDRVVAIEMVKPPSFDLGFGELCGPSGEDGRPKGNMVITRTMAKKGAGKN